MYASFAFQHRRSHASFHFSYIAPCDRPRTQLSDLQRETSVPWRLLVCEISPRLPRFVATRTQSMSCTWEGTDPHNSSPRPRGIADYSPPQGLMVWPLCVSGVRIPTDTYISADYCQPAAASERGVSIHQQQVSRHSMSIRALAKILL